MKNVRRAVGSNVEELKHPSGGAEWSLSDEQGEGDNVWSPCDGS
jgi:hypothetical protein